MIYKNVLALRTLNLMFTWVLIFLFGPGKLSAQQIGQWTFNGNTNGSAGSYNSVSIADFSPLITNKGYSGDVYYGEYTWPTGGINTSAYMEFSLTPVTGNALNVLSLTMIMRRSNTGSPAGSGPTAWSIRSSVDNYTANLAAGTLTHNAATYLVTPSTGFDRLAAKVTFRVYGYSATTSSGGQSRLVFDNIKVIGSNITLASNPDRLSAKYIQGEIALSATLTDPEPGNSYTIERSQDAINYLPVKTIDIPAGKLEYVYTCQDILSPNTPKKLYYRLCRQRREGSRQYSAITLVTLPAIINNELIVTRQGNSILLASGWKRPCTFNLFSSSGKCVLSQSFTNNSTNKLITLPGLTPGIYYGSLSDGKARRTAAVVIN
ncbi:MAG: hypothetical protein ABI687_09575 [Flavitalea sp.]